MPKRIPGLDVEGLNGDYFEMIKESYQVSERPKVVLFLGSNIGNFTTEDAMRFMQALNNELRTGDMVLVGFDLKKNPKDILAAYNDRVGITKAFNLNLLKRINNELDANFNIEKFDHFPTYDPITGSCKSYLISLEEQQVKIAEKSFSLDRNEAIWTELSQKYAEREVRGMATITGFKTIDHFYDCKHWFIDALWEKR